MSTTLIAEWSQIREHAHQEQPRSMSDLHIDAFSSSLSLRRAAILIENVSDRVTNPIDRANLLSAVKTIHDAAVLIDTFANLDEE